MNFIDTYVNSWRTKADARFHAVGLIAPILTVVILVGLSLALAASAPVIAALAALAATVFFLGAVTDAVVGFGIFCYHNPESDACALSWTSPLILDLDGDGVEAGGVTFFDFAGDGTEELTGWASADDGLLALEINGNGRIDDGSELFGDYTMIGTERAANGFAALAQMDSNGDGLVSAADDRWQELKIMRWSDTNSNGIRDRGESRLESLAANGVAKLRLAHTAYTKVDADGHEHRQVGDMSALMGLSGR